MIDDIPYIIVDNRKIAPLHRVATPGSVSAERPNPSGLSTGSPLPVRQSKNTGDCGLRWKLNPRH